jgi:hypothetical protein
MGERKVRTHWSTDDLRKLASELAAEGLTAEEIGRRLVDAVDPGNPERWNLVEAMAEEWALGMVTDVAAEVDYAKLTPEAKELISQAAVVDATVLALGPRERELVLRAGLSDTVTTIYELLPVEARSVVVRTGLAAQLTRALLAGFSNTDLALPDWTAVLPAPPVSGS